MLSETRRRASRSQPTPRILNLLRRPFQSALEASPVRRILWGSSKSSAANPSGLIRAPFVIVPTRRIVTRSRHVKIRVPIHIDVADMAIHKTDHALRVLNSALPSRELLRLMPGPRENSGSLQRHYRSGRVFYGSLLAAEHAGIACFLQDRRGRVGPSVAAAEVVT